MYFNRFCHIVNVDEDICLFVFHSQKYGCITNLIIYYSKLRYNLPKPSNTQKR